MDFGLGLILSFTDNATAGINNAVNSLNQLTTTAEGATSSLNQMASLSALSVVAGQLGDSFLSAGNKIMSTVSSLLNQSLSIGGEFENFDVTLTALFGGAEEGAAKSQDALTRLFNFAKKSPLEVGDVKDMIVTLQSQGINAFDEATGAITGTRQEFLAFLTDLKSFKPEVSNQRFKMAIQNYIGSGEKKMMRTVFDMGDIEQIIGHSVSDTAEGRMQDIIEMVENKGLTGLSESMAETMVGIQSNVSDAFTQIYYSIASNGVFDKLKSAFKELVSPLLYIEPEQLATIGKNIADSLGIVLDPIVKVAHRASELVSTLLELCETRPELIKWGMRLVVVSGAALTLVGVLLKLTSAMSGVSLLLLTMGKSFGDIGTLFTHGIGKILASLAPLALAVGAIYLVWSKDLGGVKTTVTNFATNVVTSFRTANTLVNGSLSDLETAIAGFNPKSNFFDGLTLAITKFLVLLRAVAEGWSDFEVNDDTYAKMEALGLTNLVSRIFDFLFRFREFKAGFLEGVEEVVIKVKEFFSGLLQSFDGTIFEAAFKGLENLFTALTNNDPQAWHDLGKAVGEFAANVLIIGFAFKTVHSIVTGVVGKLIAIVTSFITLGAKIGGVFTKLKGVFTAVAGFFSKVAIAFKEVWAAAHGGFVVPTKLGAAFIKIYSVVSKAVAAIKGAFIGLSSAIGAPVAAVVGVVLLAVASIATFIIKRKERFMEMVSDLWGHIKGVVDNVKGYILNAVGIFKQALGPAFAMIKEAIFTIKNAVSSFINSEGVQLVIGLITDKLAQLGQVLVGVVFPVIKTLVTLVGGVLKSAFAILGGVLTGLFTAFSSVFSGIVNVVAGAIQIITGIIDTITGLFKGIITFFLSFFTDVEADWSTFFSGLSNLGTGVLNVFKGVLEGICGVLLGIVQAIGGAIGGVVTMGIDLIKGLWTGISSMFGNLVTSFIDFWKSVIDAIKNFLGIHSPSTLFAEIGTNLILGLLNGISSLWNTITSFFTNALSGLKTMFTNAWSNIKSTVTNTVNNIKTNAVSAFNNMKSNVTNAVTGLKDNIVSGFNGAKEHVLGVASDALNWGKDIVSNISSGIKNNISKVKDAVKGVADKIKSFLHFSVPDEGPLTDFESWMPDFMQGLASTMTNSSGVVTTALNNFSAGVKNSLTNNTLQTFQQFGSTWVSTSNSISSSTITLGNTVTNTFTQVSTLSTKAFTVMTTTVSSSFANMASSVSESMNHMVSTITSSVNAIRQTMNFEWSLPQLKLPHFTITGSFNLDPPTAPQYKVDWYGLGGVFDKPNIIGVGEQGAEAVMPLETNTGWIDVLAQELATRLVPTNTLTPVNTQTYNTTNETGETQYMTSNVQGDTQTEHNVDNSIVFSEGSIVLNIKSATREEADKFADYVIERAERQRQIKSMATYNS